MKNVYITDRAHQKLALIKLTERARLGYNISYCHIVSELINEKFNKIDIPNPELLLNNIYKDGDTKLSKVSWSRTDPRILGEGL